MTHFGVVVLVPDGTQEIDAAVTKLLAPYDENTHDFVPDECGGHCLHEYSDGVCQRPPYWAGHNQWGRPGSRWDWWMIGGRWSGYLSPEYDPETDPRNIKDCEYCEATGTTTAAVGAKYPAYLPNVGKQCRQCDGKGRSPTWPTEWVQADEHNIKPVSEVPWPEIQTLPSLVTPDGVWHEAVEGGFGMFGAERGPRTPEDDWRKQFMALVESNPDAIAVMVDCHV